MVNWKCSVCGFEYSGEKPPAECPFCSSPPGEFRLKEEFKKFTYDGKKFDVLLINGSAHRSHNTSILAQLAEQELKKKKLTYRRLNLNELDIQHCWCCYSIRDAACTFPCRNQQDDMPEVHNMILNSKAVAVVSPINWNNMPCRLKDFLDRCTCIENLPLLGKSSPTAGKALALLVTGHEDGAAKTAMEIFFYFQQMGFILAPFGFAYRTRGAGNNAETDNGFLSTDRKLKKDVESVISNLSETLKLGAEAKLKGKLKEVCE